VGGRILKDKLFWFASFELLRYYVLGQFRVFGFRLTAGKSGPWTTSEWPTIQELARPLNTRAFIGSYPMVGGHKRVTSPISCGAAGLGTEDRREEIQSGRPI
jgi:hypothetical protein